MSVIYLIRHGQASFGTDNYDQLSAVGREQSAILGSYFAALGEPIDRIYTGTLARQRVTAQLIADALGPHTPPLTVEPAFDEYDSESILNAFASSLTPAQREQAGWPGLHSDRRRFQFFLERAARAWVDGLTQAEGMLPWRSFHSRIIGAIDTIMRTEGRSKTLLISTSGGVIGTIVAHVLGCANHLGIELNWAVHNASITRLIYSADKVSLSMFNGLPHLDQEGRRQLITYR
ncbi:MAG TPA: histidine phosphatase family protein [Steroidobacteraceae bacterium]|nr:histidine phosphatase family protein [Steroidobacteraceae bacterium]